jgi:NADH-quinone oxidoreductase subunit N
MLPPSAFDIARQTLVILLPELLILLVATAMMTAGVFVRYSRRFWCSVAAWTLLGALAALLAVGSQTIDLYSAIALNDDFSFNSRLVLLLTSLVLLAMAHDHVDDARAPEFFGALLMINAGSMLIAAANELVFLFVGLELVSIPTYLLLYLSRRNTTTQEAATKYFYLSIFSSGLLLYGLAFLYGLTGVSNLKALAYLMAHHVPSTALPHLGLIAVVFVMAGLGFRVAAVPFHFYAPDVYQGSPTVIAALLAWVPKAIGFLAMTRVLTAVISAAGAGSPLAHKAVLLTWIIAVVTMTLGNTVALLQDDLKRLLAYSSIAHAGYLMIGATVAFSGVGGALAPSGTQGILFYLVAYALMTLGIFAVIVALSTAERPIETVNDLAGLGQTHPVLALAAALCLFSLAGIPPLAGFYGKFEIFMSAFNAASGPDAGVFWWLAIIGVLNAAVGAYYYLRIVVLMYLRPAPSTPPAPRIAWPTAAALAACAGLSLVVGIFPGPIARSTHTAAQAATALPEPAAESVAAANAH